MKTPKFERVGSVDVDAGCVWIGDPCYILDGKRPDDLGSNWIDVCRRLDGLDTKAAVSFRHNGGHEGLGVVVGTAWGDGTYPVSVERDRDGRVLRVLIDFDPSDEEV